MKGVILAGGTGSRLYPITKTVNKHLLPVYDKPLIYYPLSNLLLTGCKEIIIISNPEYLDDLESLLGNGKNYGVKLYYQEQPKPEGIPSAISLAKKFSNGEDIWVSLGDNFIFGSRLQEIYEDVNQSNKATLFIKYVGNINGFGSADLVNKKIVDLKEKPNSTLPGWAVTGLYKFPNSVFDFIKQIKPSSRNETEVIDLLSLYLKSDNLDYKIFGRGVTWVDCGTVDDLKLADNYVNNYQKINNTLICSPEEIAFNLKLISESNLLKNMNKFKNSEYFKKLKNTIE